MDMPKPGPVHEKLARFAGTWSGQETMHPSPWDPKGGLADATLTSRVACDGFWIVGDYEQRRGGVVTFRGHSIFGFDAKTQEVVLHWFDSMGMGPDVFRGKFSGETLAVICENSMGRHRMTYDFSEKRTLRSRMESTLDGDVWQPMFDGVYHQGG